MTGSSGRSGGISGAAVPSGSSVAGMKAAAPGANAPGSVPRRPVGAPPVTRRVPTRLAMALAMGFESLHRVARRADEPRLTRFLVSEMSTAHWFDISAARRDLGYCPEISIAEGLKKLRIALAASH